MNRSNFRGRASIHDLFVNEIERDLKSWGFQVYRNGRENIHPDMHLNRANDPGARWIRFSPDLAVVWRGITCYFDPKCSCDIEKEPYNHYIEMIDNRIPVYCVFISGNTKRFSYVADIPFKDGDHPIWPIDEDGWIAPRNHPRYYEYKRSYPLTGRPYPGSGTSFLEIYFNEMQTWGPLYINFDLSNRTNGAHS